MKSLLTIVMAAFLVTSMPTVAQIVTPEKTMSREEAKKKLKLAKKKPKKAQPNKSRNSKK
jgi:hypothetical protein